MRLELTSRSSYAIRAVIAIARAQEGELGEGGRQVPIPTSRIAAEMAIPRRFLPQVMGDLVRAGLVTARVGRTGGYRLARPPARLPLLEIIEASEGDTRRFRCVLRGISCSTREWCEIHAVVNQAQQALRDRLSAATVADVIAQ